MIPNGWRYNREWHNAHYFRAGTSLCGLNNPGGATKDVGGRVAVPRCVKCRDEFSQQLHLISPRRQSILDMIGEPKVPPMA